MIDHESFLCAALGRSATLGDLYDARGDCFLGINVFHRRLPDSAVTTIVNDSTQYKFFSSDKLSDKIEQSGARGDQSLSLLSGLIDINGSGEYLMEQKKSAHEQQVTLMQELRTLDEFIELDDDTLENCVDLKALREEATHVVVGIEWGANTNVVITQGFSQGEDKEKWAFNIGGELNKLFGGVLNGNVSGKADSDNSEEVLSKELSVKVFADIFPNKEDAIVHVEEAVQSVKNMRFCVESTNEGKGRQIHFHMLPLSTFVKAFDKNIKINNVLYVIEAEVIKQVEQLVDQVNELLEKLSDFCAYVEQNKQMLPNSVVEETRVLMRECQVEYAELKKKLGNTLRDVRSGKLEASELVTLVRSYLKNLNITFVPKMLGNATIYKRIQLNEKLREERIEIDGEKLRTVCSLSDEKENFVLFYSFDRDHTQEHFEKTIQSFISLKRNEPDSQFIAVDDDIYKDAWKAEGVPAGIRICVIRSGTYTDVDLLKELEEQALQCEMKCLEEMVKGARSVKGVPVELICPKWLAGEKCAGNIHEWVCEKCRTKVDYGFDGNFYCDCGYQTVDKFSFRCSDPHHGDQYVAYGPALDAELKKIQPMEELVILVIGETGVGKSTWINAIANYITHETWEQACKDELTNLIPTSFFLSATDENGTNEIVVRVGASTNEVDGTTGASSTQHPRSYLFSHGQKLYRIIDTPGIGDTRGLQKDRENINNIFSYITQFKEIHLICFLMLPDVPKLTAGFEFCFKELIKQFHCSAVNNIVFCFTKASASSFMIGQTNLYLKKFVKQIKEQQNVEIPLTNHTEFVFDNMAYRYLCAIHENVDESVFESLKDLYHKSFMRSRQETIRLLQRAIIVQPHHTQDSANLNYARNLILKLSGPLVCISNAVKKTLVEIEEHKKDIVKYRDNEKELKRLLNKKISIVRYKMERIDERMCKECTTVKLYYGNDRAPYIEADPELKDKDPLELYYGANLKPNGDGSYSCPVHGQDFTIVKMGKTFKSFTEEQIEEDLVVRQRMNESLNSREKIELKLKELSDEKAAIEAEYKQITQASAKFAIFLSQNAITAYNDATEQYLNQLIGMEKHTKVTQPQRAYEQMLEEYQQEKKIILDNLTAASTAATKCTITPSEVQCIAAELQKLTKYGNDIRAALLWKEEESRRTMPQDICYARHKSIPRRVYNYARKFF